MTRRQKFSVLLCRCTLRRQRLHVSVSAFLRQGSCSRNSMLRTLDESRQKSLRISPNALGIVSVQCGLRECDTTGLPVWKQAVEASSRITLQPLPGRKLACLSLSSWQGHGKACQVLRKVTIALKPESSKSCAICGTSFPKCCASCHLLMFSGVRSP